MFFIIIIHCFTRQTSYHINSISFTDIHSPSPLSVLHSPHRYPFSVTVMHSPLPFSILHSFSVWSGCTPYLSRGCMRDFRVCISRWNIYVSRYCGIYICIYVRGGGIHTYKTYFLFLLYWFIIWHFIYYSIFIYKIWSCWLTIFVIYFAGIFRDG